ncbi:uncharacterized protein LOC121730689 [Aricia agestis]|uniref:uncharacterized protein LOC121730689 n=1 Tax=Aricia agestis TaxID=91739 RepID=UPI001C20A30F|nr:uncharacterized protein LOC121730689 [Aricia agestis]
MAIEHCGIPLTADAIKTKLLDMEESENGGDNTSAFSSGGAFASYKKNRNVGHTATKDNAQMSNTIMVHVPKQKRLKWDRKSEKCILVGYSNDVKGYRVYNPKTDVITTSRDVVILEKTEAENIMEVRENCSDEVSLVPVGEEDSTLQEDSLEQSESLNTDDSSELYVPCEDDTLEYSSESVADSEDSIIFNNVNMIRGSRRRQQPDRFGFATCVENDNIFTGKAQTASTDDRAQTFFCNFNCTFENCISRFFDTEELPSDNYLTPAEQECENIFEQTTSRDSNGRYSVALPFKADPASLGESRHIAERRFLSLERRLSVNPLVKREYDKIINEYIEKGYITIVNNNTLNSNQYYVIPHHAVVRGDKLTTKVRMVLNASMKTSSGISLNDILHTGRNLQSDLFRIILNFRLFPVAVSADIRQMFLQVTVKESFRQYQRILYRFNSNEPIQLYQFNRVTFGMTCSPYLAMRVIRQLMNDERSRFPIAVAALEKDAIYTDDVALSFRNTAEAITASKQLIDLFAAGGFDLVKFASNSSNFLGAMPSEARVTDLIDIGSDGNLKILGLQWSPASDNFCFRVTEDDRKCTKRNILSFVARIWDLMGFVAPVFNRM